MKKKRKTDSFYKILGQTARKTAAQRSRQTPPSPDLCKTIKMLRLERNLTGIGLCARSGDMDPRTLTALEKGRIKNPSIKTLQSLARGLGMTVSEIFRRSESLQDHYLYQGSQKGLCQMDFPLFGVRMVSFTPFVEDFFCGKLILGPRKKIDQTFLKKPVSVFISVIFGRFEITVESRKVRLREGENLFFNGILRHSFYNPLERESVMLFITAPSFL
ncbi:MAG TPA: helix-turn-helix domain-containing protein [bacterium]|nr:helix-turn-helix domain-containing protein [bacterium]